MQGILNHLRRAWRAQQRAVDVAVLWPSCVTNARTLEDAKFAFGFHAFNDPAWTTDMTELQIYRFIDALEAPEDLRC